MLEQLAVGGVLVIPVGTGDQMILKVTKNKDGSFKKQNLLPVRYVPLTSKEH